MNHIHPQDGWPESWLFSYKYDCKEIYGDLSHRGHTYSYALRLRQTIEMVGTVARPGARILDLAAAQGNFTLVLAEHGYDVTWNDLREELSGYIALKHERGKIHFSPGNIFDLEVKEPYDIVLATEVIEHVAHPDLLLAKVSSFVKPGGYVVLTTPNGEFFRNRLPKFSDCPDPSIFEQVQFKPDAEGHIFLLTVEEIRRFAQQCGLILSELRFFTIPLTKGRLGTSFFLQALPRQVCEFMENACQKLPLELRRRMCLQMGAILRKPELESGIKFPASS